MFMKRMADSTALTHGMADRLGFDVASAMARNPDAQAQAFRSAVMRCMQCSEQEGCKRLQAGNATLDAAPGYCRNDWG